MFSNAAVSDRATAQPDRMTGAVSSKSRREIVVRIVKLSFERKASGRSQDAITPSILTRVNFAVLDAAGRD